ncbi:MAG TPA: LysR family transcriptional regulator [Pseudomonas sp.]|uniref:LysR family transcriptional regulator n=1 Tax=Pseudomonas sp. TaxID=306 RepID=UPI002EDAD1C3
MKTPPDYSLIATFVAVADENSFSKAAAKLKVSKGTVSRAIAKLEESVGAELIHRTTHSMALSTAGIAFYERTAHYLKALDEALTTLPERAETPSGLLRLTSPRDFGAIVLPQLLSQFAWRYPEITFDLRITHAYPDLVGEGVDVAIHPMAVPLKDSTLKIRHLGTPKGGFYAAPSYLARRGRPRWVGADDHDWVFHSAIVALWQLQKLPTKYLVDDFFLARNLLRDGAGVGPLLTFIAEPYVRDGLLEAVPLSPPSDVRGSYVLLYPSSGQVPKKVSVFCDFVTNWVQRYPL